MNQPSAIRALMTGVIDYAGLFPPASLSLDESIRNYARYLAGPDRWMLGRFICPAGRLTELLPYVQELFGGGEPLAIAALGRGGPDSVAFRSGLGPDLGAIAAFNDAAAGRAKVDVLETRLLIVPVADLPSMLEALEGSRRTGLRPFCEFGFDARWRDSFARMLAPLMVNAGLGFKLRSGGIEAAAFPAIELVAASISLCRQAGIPMKFTAGLHHPVRHYSASVSARMHGFLNVFMACILASARGFEEGRLRQVLEEEDPEAFGFDDRAGRWRDERVATDQIEAVRRAFAISFGSCSFDEPREDLRALGMIS
jgi:hypothetical protein